MSLSLKAFWQEHGKWSEETFGSPLTRGPSGPLKHLAKEAVEAQADTHDLSEYADCLLLTFDATRRAGFTFDELVMAAWEKLEICQKREWQIPTNPDEPVEHVRADKEPVEMFKMPEWENVRPGYKLRSMPKEEARAILEKYAKEGVINEGYFFDEEDHGWHPIEEIWEALPETELQTTIG